MHARSAQPRLVATPIALFRCPIRCVAFAGCYLQAGLSKPACDDDHDACDPPTHNSLALPHAQKLRGSARADGLLSVMQAASRSAVSLSRAARASLRRSMATSAMESNVPFGISTGAMHLLLQSMKLLPGLAPPDVKVGIVGVGARGAATSISETTDSKVHAIIASGATVNGELLGPRAGRARTESARARANKCTRYPSRAYCDSCDLPTACRRCALRHGGR